VIERQKFKKDYLKGKKDSVLNTNDNIIPQNWDQKLKTISYTGG
jgi:hypothetical protein